MKPIDIRYALKILRQGGVVAFPSETSYGLACDPRSPGALRSIYRLKGREKGKPLPLIASSLTQVRSIAYLNSKAQKLAKRYWPGPLTLVLSSKTKLPSSVAPRGNMAIRVSSHPTARRLARGLGFPITATSANLSGESAAQSASEVSKVFGGRLHVIDGGRLRKSAPSTIVQVEPDGSLRILRRGAIKL